MKITLQKLIASTNNYSRRQVEQLIKDGRVFLNGRVATLSDRADNNDEIKIGRTSLILKEPKKIYLKLNKPKGYTCTNKEFKGEKNIFELINLPEKLFVVGRLDKDSRGLLLLTNDGALTQKISHPRFEHKKVYEVRIENLKGYNPTRVCSALLEGVDIGDDGIVRARGAKYLQNNQFIITLSEGKKRQIRRMMSGLNLQVIDLRRINLAGIELGGLAEGKWEYLSQSEISLIKNK